MLEQGDRLEKDALGFATVESTTLIRRHRCIPRLFKLAPRGLVPGRGTPPSASDVEIQVMVEKVYNTPEYNNTPQWTVGRYYVLIIYMLNLSSPYQLCATLASKRTLSTNTRTMSAYFEGFPFFAFPASALKVSISRNSTSSSWVFSFSAGYNKHGNCGVNTLITCVRSTWQCWWR